MSQVVVIGGGYAGAHAARRARAAGAQVVVVDPDAQHALTPRFAAVAAGRLPTSAAVAPIEELLDVEVVPDRAVAVDPQRRTVTLAGGDALPYGALVVTTGAVPSAPPVDGLVANGVALAGVEDVLRLRDRIDDLAGASSRAGATTPDDPEQASAPSLIIVGGGATGVQVAAEVAHRHPGVPVTVVELAARLLPSEPRSLGRAATRLLRAAGVEVRTGRSVTAVDADGALLDDGTRLDGLTAWAGGWQAAGSELLPHAATDGGRLVVGPDLAVAGHDHVFAAGDTAAHTDLLGRPLPMSAQIASQAGDVAGRNAAAVVASRPTRRSVLVELGRVIDLGGGVGVASLGPVRLARRPLDRVVPLLHLAIDLRHLWQVGGLRGVVGHAPGPAAGFRHDAVYGAGSPAAGDGSGEHSDAPRPAAAGHARRPDGRVRPVGAAASGGSG